MGNVIHNREDYPLALEPVHIQEILNMGQRQTYEFVKEVWKQKAPFPVIRPGRDYKIPREPFFNWFEGADLIQPVDILPDGTVKKYRIAGKDYVLQGALI